MYPVVEINIASKFQLFKFIILLTESSGRSSPVSSEEDVCCESINLLHAEEQDYGQIQEPFINM